MDIIVLSIAYVGTVRLMDLSYISYTHNSLPDDTSAAVVDNRVECDSNATATATTTAGSITNTVTADVTAAAKHINGSGSVIVNDDDNSSNCVPVCMDVLSVVQVLQCSTQVHPTAVSIWTLICLFIGDAGYGMYICYT